MFCRPFPFLPVLLLTFSVSAGAEEFNPSFRVRTWTTEDGLPQNRVACIKQTRDGYLWLGTWFGLARFDGARFVVFNRANTSELPSDAISALAEDDEGALWIATREGLVKFQRNHFTCFTATNGLPHSDVWRLEASRRGGIWLQSGDSIVRRKQERFSVVWRHAPGDYVHNIREDSDAHLNVFVNRAWIDISPDGLAVRTNFLVPESAGKFLCAEISETPGEAFIATKGGLERVRGGQTNGALVGKLDGVQIGMVRRDKSNQLWAKVEPGDLARFDGENWNRLDLAQQMGGIVCMEEDAQGNIWCGTENGLVQLRPKKIRMVAARDGLPSDEVHTICQSADGQMWLGSEGLAVANENRAEELKLTPLANQMIYCVWPARDGGVWTATQLHGIQRVAHGECVESLHHWADSIFEDKHGRLWVSTSDRLYCYSNHVALTLPPALESLRSARAIFEQADSLWFGLKTGLARWHNGELSVFTNCDGAIGYVWAIHADADGALWLGTEKGLLRFANEKLFRFTLREQMPDDAVNCILSDDADHLWFSTLHGMYRVARAQLNAVANGKANAARPFIIGTADGMATAESNGERQPAGWKARDGKLWFATGKGAAIIDPKNFPEQEVAPPLIVESVKADGKEIVAVSSGKPLKISAGCGYAVTFQFTTCDLAAPEQVRFRTRLSGVDKDWTEPTPQRQATYFNLPPGSYGLEILAVNHHGIESEPAKVEFAIAPCFWQTIWFYALCGGGVIAVGVGVQAYRLHWQKRLLQLEQQQALANERTRIARDLHDDLGTALTGLALELDVLGRDGAQGRDRPSALNRAAQHTRSLAERMREVVWAVNPRCDTVPSVVGFLEQQAAQLLGAAGLNVRLDFPEDIPEIPMDTLQRHQLALSVREAFTNVVRHAKATQVDVRLEVQESKLMIHVRDNGCGFSRTADGGEHGLSNMTARMKKIGGTFHCDSQPGRGTTIRFVAPLNRTNLEP